MPRNTLLAMSALAAGLLGAGGAMASNFGQQNDQAVSRDQWIQPWQRTSPSINSVAPGANAQAVQPSDAFTRPRDGNPRALAPALTPPPAPNR